MKVIPGFLAVLVLSGALSLSAAAAEQPITVTIDQQKLNLTNSAPLQENNTVLVPMRPIFEKLGLKLVWDAKSNTITATKEGLTIKLQLGSKKASVNGTVKQLVVAPKMIKNVTYVPLRFVSEATGNDVSWNARSKSVEITSVQNTVDMEGITELFEKYIDYSNGENTEGFMSLIDPESPLVQIEPLLKEQAEKYDTATSILQMDVLDAAETEATVRTIETTDKISGPFMPNSKSEYVYLITRSSSKAEWKISSLQLQAVQYNLPEQALNAAVSIPKADEDAIKAVLQANIDYTNKENLEGVLTTVDEASPAFVQTRQILTQVFQLYDLEAAIETSKIIDYTGTEAAIYAVQTTKTLKGPQLQNTRSHTVTTVKKTADGKWKLVQTYPLSTEVLK